MYSVCEIQALPHSENLTTSIQIITHTVSLSCFYSSLQASSKDDGTFQLYELVAQFFISITPAASYARTGHWKHFSSENNSEVPDFRLQFHAYHIYEKTLFLNFHCSHHDFSLLTSDILVFVSDLAWSLERGKAVNISERAAGVIGNGQTNGVIYALISDQGNRRFQDLARRNSSGGDGSNVFVAGLVRSLVRDTVTGILQWRLCEQTQGSL